MGHLAALRGAAIYEFWMQIRRRSVWLLLGLLSTFMLWVLFEGLPERGNGPDALVPQWAWSAQLFLPVGFGVLLADRFPRDRRTGAAELLEATPTGDALRLVGKYLGAVAATMVPIVITYALGLVVVAQQTGDPARVAALAVPAFLVVNLPGLLFVAGFSIACPIVLPVPLYQFLFIGYWFWGNALSPSVMPTLSDTWLTPVGRVAEEAFFPAANLGFRLSWGTVDGIASIVLLLAGACAALIAGLVVLRWQRAAA